MYTATTSSAFTASILCPVAMGLNVMWPGRKKMIQLTDNTIFTFLQVYVMDNPLTFRPAVKEDLATIVQMLADDTLGAEREKPGADVAENYTKAFDLVAADPNQELTIAELNKEIVATFQLTFIPYLTYQGGLRAQVEAVRTSARHRGKGIGTRVFDYIINRAREKGCHLIQLTTDKKRPDAIRFYESMGFAASHEGMKLHL
jgi:GNAT superfamily N-acetyltransferase